MPVVSFVTADGFDAFVRYDKVVVVGFFDPESDFANNFYTIADASHQDYVFGHSVDRALAQKHGVPFPGVAVFKQYDEHKDIYAGENAVQDMHAFIHASARPSIEDMTPKNYQQLLGAKSPLAYIFVTSDEERSFYHAKLGQVARRAEKEMKFVFVNANLYGAHAEEVGLRAKFPTFGIQTFNPDAHSPIDQSVPLTPEAILDHLKYFLEANDHFSFNLDGISLSEEPTAPADEPSVAGEDEL